LCLFRDCLMFAKCIRQNFLISILPPDLLICLEGKTLTDQHIESAFYPHRSANQHFTPARCRSNICKNAPNMTAMHNARMIVLKCGSENSSETGHRHTQLHSHSLITSSPLSEINSVLYDFWHRIEQYSYCS